MEGRGSCQIIVLLSVFALKIMFWNGKVTSSSTALASIYGWHLWSNKNKSRTKNVPEPKKHYSKKVNSFEKMNCLLLKTSFFSNFTQPVKFSCLNCSKRNRYLQFSEKVEKQNGLSKIRIRLKQIASFFHRKNNSWY